MTLEAWVYPTTVSNAWRDVVYKGDDNYYLMATSTAAGRPAGGGIFGGTGSDAFGAANLALERLDAPRDHLRRATLRLYVNGCRSRARPRPGPSDLDQPAPDRWRRDLRPVLHRAHRRGAGVSGGAQPVGDPGRHGNSVGRAAGYDGAVSGVGVGRERGELEPCWICRGRRRRTTSVCRATRSSVVRVRVVRRLLR